MRGLHRALALGLLIGCSASAHAGFITPINEPGTWRYESDEPAISLDDGPALPATIERLAVPVEAFQVAVPEPGSAALFGFGLAGLAIVRRLRRRAPPFAGA